VGARSRLIFAVAFSILGMATGARADAVVVVAEGAGSSPEAVETIRSIAATELRAHGVAVLEDTRFRGVVSVDPEAMQAARELGADRLFVFRLGELRKKILMSLEELQPPSSTPLFVARLTASSLDEADTVVPRLVRAILEREPVEKGARMATVTDNESEPFNKKPGEGLFILGVGLEPLGFSIGWSHEAEDWRLGFLAQGGEDTPSFLGVDGAWIPYDGNTSPYLGVGLGIVGAAYEGLEDDGGDHEAVGAKLEAGVEFFRLHGTRLIAGVNVIIPFEELRGTDDVSVGLHLRVGF